MVPVTDCDAKAVVNATEPPDDAAPDTTRSALLSWVVDFVQPVGAEVCANSIAVPAGRFVHAPVNVVAVTVPVTLTPPDGTVTPPVIFAPPDDTVNAPESVVAPALETVIRAVPPVETINPRTPGEAIVVLDASADMVVRDVPLLDS